ncbi:SDR family NAD(P)-dependent oxidoreductase [Oceanicola sp. 22II-s10i]|uniref:SDR family NAD(P)-dependent oxidoreductase n=1 Tax=Oceanicola sp. 22II-s10i TaxID=1317116 RepID=UPI0020CED568|nr:SDR family oxidoreductase [Oceanicola sp. 22II-s10i]
MTSLRPEHAVVVTGASRGIGAQIARALHARGAAVACLSRGGTVPEGVASTALQPDGLPMDQGRNPTSGPALRGYAVDITDATALADVFNRIAKDFGGIRALVNNAGVHEGGRSARVSNAAFLRMLEVNALGVFAAAREVYPHLIEQGGDIINIGSVFETLGAPMNACYSASKAAAGALTRALAAEWGPHGINVVDLAPGYVETDMNRDYMARPDVRAYLRRQTTLGRALSAEEVGVLTAQLLEMDLALLNGQTIRADGGHTVCHGLLENPDVGSNAAG